MKNFKFKKQVRSINYDDLNRFYFMLLKYKQNNPNFKHNNVINKLYPNLDWTRIKIIKN